MVHEDRYIVIKRADMEILTATEDAILHTIIGKVMNHRANKGKKQLQCVVVESDWPEYETVWKLIEQRMDCPICHGTGWNHGIQCKPSKTHPTGWESERCDCQANDNVTNTAPEPHPNNR